MPQRIAVSSGVLVRWLGALALVGVLLLVSGVASFGSLGVVRSTASAVVPMRTASATSISVQPAGGLRTQASSPATRPANGALMLAATGTVTSFQAPAEID